MLSIFGFNNSNRDVGFVIEDVIRALLLSSGCQLSANNDAPSRQIHFLADLSMQVPACSSKGGRDKLAADVALTKPVHSRRPRHLLRFRLCAHSAHKAAHTPPRKRPPQRSVRASRGALVPHEQCQSSSRKRFSPPARTWTS